MGMSDARRKGVVRPYRDADVIRLRGSVHIEQTLANLGARRLWDLMTSTDYVHALGAVTGNPPQRPGLPIFRPVGK